MNRPCKIVFYGFLALYVVALMLLVIGSFGLFGSERDPLAGVFLVPLGVPWSLMASDAPEAMLPWIGAGAPLVNLLLIGLLCRRFGRTRAA